MQLKLKSYMNSAKKIHVSVLMKTVLNYFQIEYFLYRG